MIVGIHQPEHLPWLGFFHKMYKSDLFVLLDNVQYRKNYFQNRNRVRTHDGWCWLTVPVLIKGRSSQMINEVEINHSNQSWGKKISDTVRFNYSRAKYYAEYTEFFSGAYSSNQWVKLVELNKHLISGFRHFLGIKTPLVLASDLDVEGDSTDLLLAICRRLGATEYLSGKYGREYLDETKFLQEGIQVNYQDFHHPVYSQLYQPFVPEMSALDLLFNHGPAAMQILIQEDIPT